MNDDPNGRKRKLIAGTFVKKMLKNKLWMSLIFVVLYAYYQIFHVQVKQSIYIALYKSGISGGISDDGKTRNPPLILGKNASSNISMTVYDNRTDCKDVIYFVHNKHPSEEKRKEDTGDTGHHVHIWSAMGKFVRRAPALNNTCLVFFQLPDPWKVDGIEIHPVWGRIPATDLVMSEFPNANIFLYMDTDAFVTQSNVTPTIMYNVLSSTVPEADNDKQQRKKPGLIVNKPFTGWLCGQCEKFGLGHGCFNSGVLLWRRSKGAQNIIKSWWSSRNNNVTQNVCINNTSTNRDSDHCFHGWSKKEQGRRINDKMGEQNRLMYIYATQNNVRDSIWPVPRQLSDPPVNSSSCPSAVENHMPCLQQDNKKEMEWLDWDPNKPRCYINHLTDAKEKLVQFENVTIPW